VTDGLCLHALVRFLYLDDVERHDVSAPLHRAALSNGLTRLVALCEAHFAAQLELQLHSWHGAQRTGPPAPLFVGHMHLYQLVSLHQAKRATLMAVCYV